MSHHLFTRFPEDVVLNGFDRLVPPPPDTTASTELRVIRLPGSAMTMTALRLTPADLVIFVLVFLGKPL